MGCFPGGHKRVMLRFHVRKTHQLAGQMLANRRSLPPLNALRAFEAAARHGSFKEAAAELGGAPAAILRVNALASFSLRWLLPRLAQFRERHPGIEVRLTTSSDPVDASPEVDDVVIRGGPDTFYGFKSRFLAERRLPVCNPALAARAPAIPQRMRSARGSQRLDAIKRCDAEVFFVPLRLCGESSSHQCRPCLTQTPGQDKLVAHAHAKP